MKGSDLDAAAELIRRYCASRFPGLTATRFRIDLELRGQVVEEIRMPLPTVEMPGQVEGGPFVPTPFQKGILDALDGKAMRSRPLGAAVGDTARLYRPGGLPELQSRTGRTA